METPGAQEQAPGKAQEEKPYRQADVTLTEEHACADCEHQMDAHIGSRCRVERSNGVMCKCHGFRFRHEGPAQ